MRAFLGVGWGQVATLATLTTACVALEAIVLDAVSRLMSIPTITDSSQGGSISGSFALLMESWSRSLAGSRLFGALIDRDSLYLTTGQQAFLLIMAAIGLLAISKLVEVRLRGRILSRFAFLIRDQLITRFFNLKYSLFKQLSGRQVAHLASTEGNQAVQGVTHLFAMGNTGLSGVIYLSVAVFLNPFSTLVAIALGGGVLVILKAISGRIREVSALQLELMGRLNRRMSEVNAIYKHSRLTGSRRAASADLSALAGKLAATVKIRFDQTSKVAALQQPMMMLVLLGVLLVSIGSGLVTVDRTLIALGLIYRGVNSLMASINEYNGYLHSKSSIEGVRSFIEYLASSDDPLLQCEDDHVGAFLEPVQEVRVTDVDYSVNRIKLLSGISFHARRGEVVGIFGHSGSGKSTLLEVMMGLTSPAGGEITVNSLPLEVFIRNEGRSRIGYVGSEMLLSETAVLSQLSERLRSPNGISNFIQILNDLECGDWSRSLVSKILEGAEAERHGQLSMGQRQILILVNELMRDPEIFILDEITAHMDPVLMRRVFSHLREFKSNRITFIVSHDLALVDYCSRLIVLKGGRIAGSGSPAELHELVSSPEAFIRNSESVSQHVHHIVSRPGAIKMKISSGEAWLDCRLEEISAEGVGWIWAVGTGTAVNSDLGKACVVRLEAGDRRLVLSGIVEDVNDIGGRMVFTNLDLETRELLVSLVNELRRNSRFEDVA